MKRIVSICPSNTELLYFLGIKDWIVGVDNYSDWPIEMSHLPQVGPDLHIDIEKVKSLEPDMVVASLSVPGMEKNIDRLEKEKIPYIILNPKTLSQITDDFRTLGRLFHIETQAEQVVQQYNKKLNWIQQRIPSVGSPRRLYWEWWPKPVFTPGQRNWLTEMSRFVKAVNIFEDIDNDSFQTDWIEVAQRHPELILIVWTGVPIHRVKKELILSREAWKGEPFFREDRIHILEEGWFCRPSPRLLTGIEYLAHLLYPDRFTTPNPDAPFYIPLSSE
ncbi:cobalamin-binding protein [Hazenella coriacea]|uniref:Iron complex transport system substrate-binding protein n=1 Tax=Hazenella coriacea TaxID=1179467 RepID=A0A4R3LB02_9BACL|nr:cobalamin-binding protein [Hazenella coriacea]TCS96892.1 iron complex transport system substrate-binding protein [Hazenella coriacea]